MMNFNNLIATCFTFFILTDLCSQINFIQSNDIQVIEDQDDYNLLNAWAGGMNFCQFSEIDINLDGEKDMFIFDRSGKNGNQNGNKIIPLIYNQSIQDYVYMPEYIDNFPEGLKNWVLLIDYNQDGKEDIFTSVNNSIALFTNNSTDSLSFEFTKMLDSDAGFGPTNLYVSPVDLPAIIDVDNDCDIDILSFNPEGTNIYFHQNKSMELYNSCSTIDLYRTDNCWGKFQENFTDNSLTLNLDDNCQQTEPDQMRVHAGSTILALDLNPQNTETNSLEVLLGDISYSNLVMVLNGGEPNEALMIDQDTNFPNYDNPVNLPLFPGSFYLDVNKDGLKDLLISPNGVNISENKNSCLYYKNISNQSDDLFFSENGQNMIQFEYIQNNFFSDEMIDVGSNSKPILFDLDNDGLLDLIIGNRGYYDQANYNSRLSFYKNIGTENQPIFSKYYNYSINNDLGNLSQIGDTPAIESIHPTFGDVDLDGDVDLVFGDASGKVYIIYALNTETNAEEPYPIYPSEINNLNDLTYTGIDVGSYATPQLIDLNRDGLLDLVIGERSGIDDGIYNGINYFENTGLNNNIPIFSDNTPIFENLIDNNDVNSLGGINLMNPVYTTAYTTPHVFEYENNYHLAVGTENGQVHLFNNIENDLFGVYNSYTDNILKNINCVHSSITINDINNDGKPDLIRGNASGGLELFFGENFNLKNEEKSLIDYFKVFPNPSSGFIFIEQSKNRKLNVKIFSLTGQSIKSFLLTEKKNYLNINNVNSGIYFLQIIDDNERTETKKIIIK